MSGYAEQALEHLREAAEGVKDLGWATRPHTLEEKHLHATTGAAYALLALVEELRKFEAVAVEVGQKAVDEAVDDALSEELWGEDQ